MTKFSRTSTGKYSVAGKTYEMLIGTRAQVWHGTAFKTTGGLTHSDLMKNKTGRIVSKSKHNSAKREKRLVKAGYLTKKGHFGFVKKGKTMRKGHKGGKGLTNTHPTATHSANTHPSTSAHSSSASSLKMKGGKHTPLHHSSLKGGAMSALNPSPISGIKGTSGVNLQFVAGNAN
jgi:hypothetical protein